MLSVLKVYLLASVRLRELMSNLEPTDTVSSNGEDSLDLKKAWAVFENCVVLKTELLLNRHLDQILLATLYIIGKVRFASLQLIPFPFHIPSKISV